MENAKAFFENALGSPKTPFGGHVTVLPLFIAIVMAIIILGIVGILGFVVVLMVGFLHLLFIVILGKRLGVFTKRLGVFRKRLGVFRKRPSYFSRRADFISYVPILRKNVKKPNLNMLNYSKGTSLGEKKAYNSFIPHKQGPTSTAQAL